MTDSPRPSEPREFGPVQYIAPYLLLVLADAGIEEAPAGGRPALFWLFVAVAGLGLVSTVARLRSAWAAHRLLPLAGWTRLLGTLLAAYGLYVAYRVVDGLPG
ncbi:hypothetical protein ACGF8D_00755 [Streptomyces massasporeus]|uniref:hypothetical protein n=1 Tax=Streptomyces massasporeus TaxID=67324 RepID=UPI0037203DB9